MKTLDLIDSQSILDMDRCEQLAYIEQAHQHLSESKPKLTKYKDPTDYVAINVSEAVPFLCKLLGAVVSGLTFWSVLQAILADPSLSLLLLPLTVCLVVFILFVVGILMGSQIEICGPTSSRTIFTRLFLKKKIEATRIEFADLEATAKAEFDEKQNVYLSTLHNLEQLQEAVLAEINSGNSTGKAVFKDGKLTMDNLLTIKTTEGQK